MIEKSSEKKENKSNFDLQLKLTQFNKFLEIIMTK